MDKINFSKNLYLSGDCWLFCPPYKVEEEHGWRDGPIDAGDKNISMIHLKDIYTNMN